MSNTSDDNAIEKRIDLTVDIALFTVFMGNFFAQCVISYYEPYETDLSSIKSFAFRVFMTFLIVSPGILILAPSLRLLVWLLDRLNLSIYIKSFFIIILGCVIILFIAYLYFNFNNTSESINYKHLWYTSLPFILSFTAYTAYKNIWNITRKDLNQIMTRWFEG